MGTEDIKVKQGATRNLEVTTAVEEDAVQVKFLVRKDKQSPIIIDKDAMFNDGVAYIDLTEADTDIPFGKYFYQFTVFYETGVDKFPTGLGCDSGDCGFPMFIVCESLDGED